MSRALIDLVLPRMAKTLHRQLERFRAGQMDESQFTDKFERLLQRQHAWLISKGVSDLNAALAIHGAVLVLSRPGLRAEASEQQLPLELIETRAVKDAALDVAQNYGLPEPEAFERISELVACHEE